MQDLPLTAGITLLIVLLMFATAANVGMARKRFNVVAPAVSGHPQFERAYRIQMNTLEWALMVLPCLWVCAVFVGDGWAALGGGVWLLGRVWYAVAYQPTRPRAGRFHGGCARLRRAQNPMPKVSNLTLYQV